jgi:hypothetical protein
MSSNCRSITVCLLVGGLVLTGSSRMCHADTVRKVWSASTTAEGQMEYWGVIAIVNQSPVFGPIGNNIGGMSKMGAAPPGPAYIHHFSIHPVVLPAGTSWRVALSRSYGWVGWDGWTSATYSVP